MPRYFSATDGCSVPELLHFGFDHLAAAEQLLRGNGRHYDSAGYLAHLGFELLLKGWILHTDGRFPGIHGLNQLWLTVRTTSRVREFSRLDLSTLMMVDSYGNLRYPNVHNAVEIGSDDLPHIAALENSLLKRMPKPLHEIIQSLHWSRKGGRVIMEKPIARTRNNNQGQK